ncbi:Ribokinase-like protein [Rhizophagus irregularis]|uniref:Adenosine kinase n=3 Tax=Rhizophagus irregularis TaxID=588596 RepID=A0A2I1EHY6_9GLOM|nr:Ribokinase-like protein [Rhizophagus irregularis DAOM 181602=DAOM 197198]EXX56607.1 adenosine kinase [Rhizophagus irregularis DAOM 197198w]PKC64843.1 Ribokinase-like protein [Rhizophagus irregularis]PKK69364.1 Ribokinase-like protein [Rhizophagus irregularis]PKY21736.1 Ribokinase-like protein [Rhizophagus irregularis]POG81926.1 Ribokinase-like protein [Rhizophagus irregularis DAOM 181602=DAOM 197198]|eukprot:XP_025188792.1 Ribokinase-like protein [Rhizophagus irregularis DAOM 181602=DAOM 197198]
MSEQNFKLLCMGNPLLDIQVQGDDSLLKKYGLDPNGAILAEEKHKPLYEELLKYKPVYVAGGAAQNSARGAQYLLPPKTTAYFGCVGDDQFAEEMRNAATNEGLTVDYLVNKDYPTGTCGVIITGHNRSLIANLSAAERYNESDHLNLPQKWNIVENAECYYISGFFLAVSPSSILKIANHAAENNKTLIMNISATYICQAFKKPMSEVAPYWDIIIGNETEAEAFATSEGWETKDLKEIAIKMAQLPKVNTKRQRVAIITHGAKSTIVGYQDGTIKEYPIIPIEDKEIEDTNGAGDAFVGGFLSQYVQGKSIDECINAGHWLANINIKLVGPAFPKEKIPYPGLV